MKRHLITIITLLISLALIGQLDLGEFLPPAGKSYTQYVALKHNGDLMSDEYDPRSECRISQEGKGKITIGAVYKNDPQRTRDDQVKFMVAIYNRRTNTRWMYTTKTVKEVSLEYVIAKCEPGDKIIFMMVDQRYNLPYNELELDWEC